MTDLDIVSKYVLPLRDVVLFPQMVLPLYIGRQHSIQSLLNAVQAKEELVLVCQRDPDISHPKTKDLFSIGVLARVLQVYRLPDGTLKILVEGSERVHLASVSMTDDHYTAQVNTLYSQHVPEDEQAGWMKNIKQVMRDYEKRESINSDLLSTLKAIDDPGVFVDFLAGHFPFSTQDRQRVLEELDVVRRIELVSYLIYREISWLDLNNNLKKRVEVQARKEQTEYYRRLKMQELVKELNADAPNDFDLIEEKINKLHASEEVKERLLNELLKLKSMPALSAEAAVVRNYLDVAVDLPWNHHKKLHTSMERAQKRLDRTHFGLHVVKDRVLEMIAMQIQNQGKVRGPILCLVGAPGVGKTSLGCAIAEALGRKFVRISLGGVRDEAEIRGHRRTYVGAMLGKIIKAIRQAKVSNPLILLDEIDKMGMDFRGDPASALLEVLDPEQNRNFVDHYLELEYDLSEVFFLTTANTLDIPPALKDRLEIIRLPGYMDSEKVRIASDHILPKILKETGLQRRHLKLSASLLHDVIRFYTREAGVRELERQLFKLARQAVRHLQEHKDFPATLSSEMLQKWLGPAKFYDEVLVNHPTVGLVNGLAWTSVGGELLHIEALIFPGKGELVLTGSLGDVMKESIRAAWSFVKAEALLQGMPLSFFQEHDVHVHVPEGATPKDGPSAGIAIATAMRSVVRSFPVKNSVAMTGEITLRGDVLRIGGLKEKLLAAHRYRISKVMIPKENMSDLVDVPEDVLSEMTVIGVNHVHQVFEHAFDTLS